MMRALIVSLLFAAGVFFSDALALDVTYTVQNHFIQAQVLKSTGQFKIATAPNLGSAGLTYLEDWNSFTLFYVHLAGTDKYFTNNIHRQSDPTINEGAIYAPADTVYQTSDTVRSIWNNTNLMSGFRIVQDLWPTQTAGGGQIIIKYSVYSFDSTASSSNALKGISLVVDTYVNSGYASVDANFGACNLNDDDPLVLTAHKYEAVPSGISKNSVCWQGVDDRDTSASTMPDWYVAGIRFPFFPLSEFTNAGQMLLAKGILRGPGLTPPDDFIVAEWGSTSEGMNNVGWNMDSLTGPTGIPPTWSNYKDAAVAYQWSGSDIYVIHGNHKSVATSYGMNDNTMNFALCNDTLFSFAGVAALDHRRSGSLHPLYDSLSIPLDIYVANTDHTQRVPHAVKVTLDLTNAPEILPPAQMSKYADVNVYGDSTLNVGDVGRASWLLQIDTSKMDPNVDYHELLTYRVTNATIPNLYSTCVNAIDITYHAYAPDNIAPVISIASQTRYAADWALSDNNNYYQTGLDKITVTTDSNMSYTPPSFRTCDTSQTPHVIIGVIDTTRRARFVFNVSDCAGNVSKDSMVYVPYKTAVNELTILPTGASVENYPNPFIGRTQVRIEGGMVAREARVRVYSLLGADVTAAGIVSDVETGGARVVTFDGSSLPAGVYTVSVITSRGAVHHRMLLAK